MELNNDQSLDDRCHITCHGIKMTKDERRAYAKQWHLDNPERNSWYHTNARRRENGQPPLTFEEHLAYLKERKERKEQRYHRPKAAPIYRGGEILTPDELRQNSMENRSTTEHYWDFMVKQEGASITHPRSESGWIAMGNGGFRKRTRGPSLG